MDRIFLFIRKYPDLRAVILDKLNGCSASGNLEVDADKIIKNCCNTDVAEHSYVPLFMPQSEVKSFRNQL